MLSRYYFIKYFLPVMLAKLLFIPSFVHCAWLIFKLSQMVMLSFNVLDNHRKVTPIFCILPLTNITSVLEMRIYSEVGFITNMAQQYVLILDKYIWMVPGLGPGQGNNSSLFFKFQTMSEITWLRLREPHLCYLNGKGGFHKSGSRCGCHPV